MKTIKEKNDLTWKEAVLHVLGDHYPSEVSLQTIYFEVRKYRKLGEGDLEINRWGEPRYQHTIRHTMYALVKGGSVERIRRGIYVLRE